MKEKSEKLVPAFLRRIKNSSAGRSDKRAAFTLTELIVVILVVSLFVLLALTNLGGMLVKNKFKAQAHQLVSIMQMAVNAAAQSDRKYEVIIDPVEQSYLLREITNPDLSQVLEEEVIALNQFSENCRVSYIEFDDGEFTNEARAKFRAGRSGFQYGGKIVLLDKRQKPYSIIVNRLNRIIELKVGDIEILRPKSPDDVPF